MKHSKSSLIERLKEEYKETGITPLRDGKREISSRVYDYHFGSWCNAIKAACIPERNKIKAIRYTKRCEYDECGEDFVTKIETQECCSRTCANKNRRVLEPPTRIPRNEWKKILKEKSLNRLLEAPFDEFGWDTKRKRIILEQENKCNKCGTDEWMGSQLPLEIDHIDGDHTNDNRDNLEGLCPNCHSITPTWRGKNKADTKVTDDELLFALQNSKNIRQALLAVGMAAKGANYRRVKRLQAGLNKYEYIKN